MLNKTDNALTTTIKERRRRWAEWIQQFSQKPPGKETPTILHIAEGNWQNIGKHTWEQEKNTVPEQLTIIRGNSPLSILFKQHPQIET